MRHDHISQSMPAMITLLLNHGADVLLRSPTPLHLLVCKSEQKMGRVKCPSNFSNHILNATILLESLLCNETNVNAKTEWDETPLAYAVNHANAAMVSTLINNGAEVNFAYNSEEDSYHSK